MSATPLEKVSWAIYCPFPGVKAYAEFSFAERSWKTGTRYSKLRGGSYTARRYEAPIEVMTLDLGTDDYVILKHKDHKQDGPGKVVMSYPHLRRFIEGLQDALELVRDGCFEEVEGAYQLTDQGYQAEHTIHDMHNGAIITLQPTIFTRVLEEGAGDNEVELAGEPGMRMFLNGDLYSDVTLDEYATFVEFYERFDLFATSRSAVQVAVAQLGGIPGVTMSKTAAAQPTRRPTAAANGLGARKK